MVARRRLSIALLCSFLAEVINKAFPIIVLYLVASRLGVEALGYAQMGMQFIDVGMWLTIFGFHTYGAIAIGRAAGDRHKIGEIIAAITLWKLVFAMLIGVAMWAVVIHTYQDLATLVFALSFLLLTTVVDTFYVNTGTQRLPLFSVATIVAKTLSLVGVIKLVQGSDDAILYAVLTFGANGLISLFVSAVNLVRYPPRLTTMRVMQKTLVGALPFAGTIVLLILFDRYDLFVADWVAGHAGAGLYAGPARLNQALIGVVGAVGTVFFAEMVLRQSAEKLTEHLIICLRILLLVLLPAAVGTYFVGPELLKRLLGESFVAGADVLNVLVWVPIAHMLLFLFGLQIHQVKGASRALNLALLVGFVAAVGMSYAGGLVYGLAGVAAGALTGKLIAAVCCIWGAGKYVTTIPASGLLRSCLPALVMAVVLYTLGSASFVATLVVGAAVYTAVAITLNARLLRLRA